MTGLSTIITECYNKKTTLLKEKNRQLADFFIIPIILEKLI